MYRDCFVIMPFTDSFDGIWENVIRVTVANHGDGCFRADDLFGPGQIMNDLIQSIRDCNHLIADLTGRNANVFYELGFAHALDKPVVLITQDLADVPFDLRHQRIIEYTDTAGGAARLARQLEKYIRNM